MSTTATPQLAPKPVILVVECFEICQILRRLLAQAGYEVFTRLPEDGPQFFRSRAADVDLVITNRPAPYLNANTPILYIAAIPDPVFKDRCAILPKPFTPSALRAVVQNMVRSPAPA